MYPSVVAAFLAVVTWLIGPIVATSSGIDAPACLTWTGEIVSGSGPVTLIGNDIEDILNQIHVVDPKYNATSNVNSVAVNDPDIQSVQCGIFATADKSNYGELQYSLRMAGENCTVPARTCLRLSCWNTSGIYVCNENPSDVTKTCVTFANFAGAIGDSCCTSSYIKSKALSGQAFSNEGWNVCVAYADCNHANNADAPSIFGLPGLNGECRD